MFSKQEICAPCQPQHHTLGNDIHVVMPLHDRDYYDMSSIIAGASGLVPVVTEVFLGSNIPKCRSSKKRNISKEVDASLMLIL